jgi:hypothetical protein
MWSKLKSVAPTLAHDFTLMADGQRGRPFPPGRYASVRIPALIMDGGKSPTWMRNAISALSKAVPNATYRTLPGQTHMVKTAVQAPVLVEFFSR